MTEFGVPRWWDATPETLELWVNNTLNEVNVAGFPLEVAFSFNAQSGFAFVVSKVAHRDDPRKVVTITFHYGTKRAEAANAFDSEEKLVWFVRYCLHDIVTHELDEWFYFKGERRFDPHKLQHYKQTTYGIPSDETCRYGAPKALPIVPETECPVCPVNKCSCFDI